MTDRDTSNFNVEAYKLVQNTLGLRRYRQSHGMSAEELIILFKYSLNLCTVCWRMYDVSDIPENQIGMCIVTCNGYEFTCCPVGINDDPSDSE